MKLASIQYDGRERVVAAVDEAYVVDVRDLGIDVPDMIALISSGPALLARVSKALAALRKQVAGRGGVQNGGPAEPSHLIPISEVTWRPPVRRPGKICGVAMNNSASNARKIKAPDHPAFFLKPASCLVGHLQPIRIFE
jgi:2-keto-4-pentenoate hydratase/2-oxohepta-3-ene-1,7-dioic acid hydratase in catechol pathway